jgi:hypothetical protein
MPNDLTIRPAPGVPPVQPPNSPVAKDAPAGPALTAVVPVTPILTLNPESGIVVVDFRNETGQVVSSIPTAQQLAAYRDRALLPAPSAAANSAARKITAAPTRVPSSPMATQGAHPGSPGERASSSGQAQRARLPQSPNEEPIRGRQS